MVVRVATLAHDQLLSGLAASEMRQPVYIITVCSWLKVRQATSRSDTAHVAARAACPTVL